MANVVKIEGFRELERALAEDLPKATAKNTLRRAAVNTMNQHIRDRAKELAPVDDGQLRNSITTKNVKAKRLSRTKFAKSEGVSVATGPTGRPEGGNAAWQEFGTVNAAAQPYMRPAADAGVSAVIGDLRDELKLQIHKAKARMARKAARGK